MIRWILPTLLISFSMTAFAQSAAEDESTPSQAAHAHGENASGYHGGDHKGCSHRGKKNWNAEYHGERGAHPKYKGKQRDYTPEEIEEYKARREAWMQKHAAEHKERSTNE